MAVSSDGVRVLGEWQRLDPASLGGTIVVLGRTDAGKSTFVRWLVGELCTRVGAVGWLDADVGQSTLGLPTTLNLAVADASSRDLPSPESTFFVGATSPRAHMLPTLVGVHRLRERALALGARAVVVDTTGLVDREAGGGALKQWKIELLAPATVVALQRDQELAHILEPLKRDPRVAVWVLPVSAEARARSPEERAERRRARFRRYFEGAKVLDGPWSGIAVYGSELARPGRLVALQDARGLTLAVGSVSVCAGGDVRILTPLLSAARVASLRIGSLCLDPETGEEIP